MERPKILIRFADLRRLAREVPAYLAALGGGREAPVLTASVEDTLSIAGLDTQELLAFASTYGVELAAFDFTGYLSADGPAGADIMLFFPVVAYLLLAWLLRAAAGAGGWLWSRELARRSWRQSISRSWLPAGWRTPAKKLTFGDFVASAASGRFVQGGQVRFLLPPA